MTQKKLPLIFAATVAISLIAGCALFGKNPSPLSGVERTFLETRTNYIPQIVWETNTVNQIIQSVVQVTNVTGAIVFQTNTVTVPVPTPVLVTNIIEEYHHTPNETAQASAGVGGTIANLIVPGTGGIVTTAILGLLSLWGGWRSTKNKNTAVAMSQEIETILEFIYALPKGAAYHQSVVNYLKDHQVEAGVAQEVLKILEKNVSNKEAVSAMEGIRSTITTLGTPLPPRDTPPVLP